MWSQDSELFETSLKKMYNEFTKESKLGGGGFQVLDGLRVSQNCFVELLNIDRNIGYQVGFQYIRQLCLHLRNIRNNLTKDALKNIYSWQMFNAMKLWVLALTDAKTSDLVLLVHPLVQLIVGVIRLTANIKYFPFHLKAFELLTLINEKTGQFVPAMQYVIHPFDASNYNFFNGKPRPLQDKSIPDTIVSLKFAKKHVDTSEAKDRIVKEALESLTLYLAVNSSQLSFPEMFVPVSVLLRKFRKNSKNSKYRSMIGTFLELVKRNEDMVAQSRAKIREKSLKDPANLHKQFSDLIKHEDTPLAKEARKIEVRRAEEIRQRLDKFNPKSQATAV